MGVVALLVVVLLIGAFWLVFKRLRDKLANAAGSMSQLAQQGVVTTGRIASTERRRMSRGEFEYFVTYAFETKDGVEHRKELRVPATHFDEFVAGQPVEIVHLPGDPSISAFQETVDEVRAKMNQSSAPQ